MNHVSADLQSLLKLTSSYLSENNIFEAQKAWSEFFSEHLLQSNPESQKTICNALLEQLPGSFAGYYYRGCAYMALNTYSAALKDLLIANEKKPREANVIYNIAVCQNHLNRYEEALVTCNQLLKLEPNNPEYLKFTAGIMITCCDTSKALKLLEKALKYDPGNIDCFIQKATCLGLMKDYPKALEIFAKAEQMLLKSLDQQESLESTINLYVNRGQMKSVMGDDDGSANDFKIVQSIINDTDIQ